MKVDVMFFFFQAEDGIRDIGVTGVQTCALPIYGSRRGGANTAPRGRACIAQGAPRRSGEVPRRAADALKELGELISLTFGETNQTEVDFGQCLGGVVTAGLAGLGNGDAGRAPIAWVWRSPD